MTDHESAIVAEMAENGWDNYDYVETFESDSPSGMTGNMR